MPTFLIFGILKDFSIGVKITKNRKFVCMCCLGTHRIETLIGTSDKGT